MIDRQIAAGFIEYWGSRLTKIINWARKSEEQRHRATWQAGVEFGLMVRLEFEKPGEDG